MSAIDDVVEERNHLKRVMVQALEFFADHEQYDQWSAVVVDNMREAIGDKRKHEINDLSDDIEERSDLEELRHFPDRKRH